MRTTSSLVDILPATILMLVVFPGTASAQSVWRYLGRVDIRAGVVLNDIEGTNAAGPFAGSFTSIGAGFGFNIPVYTLASELTLGINPNIDLAGVPGTAQEVDGRFPLTLSFETPVYATIKYGTDATWHGRSRAGLAAGIGLQYTALTMLDPADISDSYIAPTVMAEVNFRLGGGLAKLRYSTLLGRPRVDVNASDGSDAGDATLGRHAFHLIVNFSS